MFGLSKKRKSSILDDIDPRINKFLEFCKQPENKNLDPWIAHNKFATQVIIEKKKIVN